MQPTRTHGVTLDGALLTHGYEIMRFTRRLRDILRQEADRVPNAFEFESEANQTLFELLGRKYASAFVDTAYGIAAVDLSICRSLRLPYVADVGQDTVPWQEFKESSANGLSDRGKSILIERQTHVRYLESEFETALKAELGDASTRVIKPVKAVCNILLRHLYEMIDLIDESFGQERAPIETREFMS